MTEPEVHKDKYAVDDNDNVIGVMPLEEIIEKGYKRRVSRVYVFNESGSVLISRRSKNIMKPLKLDPSMGGHVEVGETYLEAAERELFEELGIDSKEYVLKEVCEPYAGDGFISAMFKVVVPDNIKINFDSYEVAEIFWHTPEEIDTLIIEKADECTASLVNSWTRLRDRLITT